ncbi:hypothetical protein LTR15_004937 [Elasticomyces elasticus]|nr:hypothetical protein LTR15_004937 [Elasticomyces elasticus]
MEDTIDNSQYTLPSERHQMRLNSPASCESELENTAAATHEEVLIRKYDPATVKRQPMSIEAQREIAEDEIDLLIATGRAYAETKARITAERGQPKKAVSKADNEIEICLPCRSLYPNSGYGEQKSADRQNDSKMAEQATEIKKLQSQLRTAKQACKKNAEMVLRANEVTQRASSAHKTCSSKLGSALQRLAAQRTELESAQDYIGRLDRAYDESLKRLEGAELRVAELKARLVGRTGQEDLEPVSSSDESVQKPVKSTKTRSRAEPSNRRGTKRKFSPTDDSEDDTSSVYADSTDEAVRRLMREAARKAKRRRYD